MKFLKEMIAKKREEPHEAEIPDSFENDDLISEIEQENISDKEIISNLSSISAKANEHPAQSEDHDGEASDAERVVSRVPDFADIVAGRRNLDAAASEEPVGDIEDDEDYMDLDDDEMWDDMDDLDDFDELDELDDPQSADPAPAATPEPVTTVSPAAPIVARKFSEIRTPAKPVSADKPVTQPLSEARTTPDMSRNDTVTAQDEPKPAAPARETAQVKKIWDLQPGAADDSHLRPVQDTPRATAQQKPEQKIAEVPQPAAGQAPRRAGRVKTRLLGFEHAQDTSSNPFDAPGATGQSSASEFPIGWMVITKGPGRGTSFSLCNGVSQIGRGDDQAIRLDFGDNSVSRNNHAAIAYDNEQRVFFLGHGGKTNLVRLNDRPVLSTEELSNWDLIRIGETTLRFVAFCGEDFDWDLENQDDSNNAAIA